MQGSESYFWSYENSCEEAHICSDRSGASILRSHARETHGEVGTAAHRAHGIEISGRLQEAREAHGMKAVAACRHERLAMLFTRETICQPFLANAAVVVHRSIVDAVLGAAAALAGSTAGCPAGRGGIRLQCSGVRRVPKLSLEQQLHELCRRGQSSYYRSSYCHHHLRCHHLRCHCQHCQPPPRGSPWWSH